MRTSTAVLLPLASILLATAARAQYPITTLTVPDAGKNDYFGSDVDVKGDRAIVGAWDASFEQSFPKTTQDGAGAVYIYRKVAGAWTLEGQVWAKDFEAIDFYGSGVGIDGTRAVVGELGDDNVFYTNTGAVYVLRLVHDIWTQEARLVTTPLVQTGAELGASVAIEGTEIVAGAPYYDQGIVSGALFVFSFAPGTGWTQQAKIVPASSTHMQMLGDNVAMSGDTIIAGAQRWGCNGLPGTCTGAAFVYRNSGGTWTLEATLTALDGTSLDHFGTDADIDGDVAVVGAADADVVAPSSGAAYVFRRSGSTWTQEAKLAPCDGHAGASFGRSVGISGDTVIVGAPFDPEGAGGGGAYVFRRENGAWTEVNKLLLPGTGAGADAGVAVAVDGDSAAVGADLNDVPATDAGRAWIVTGVASHPTWNQLGGGLAGASGTPVLAGTGTLAAGSPVNFALNAAAALSPSTLVVGLGLLCAPLKGGLLVPAPDVLVAGLVTDGAGSFNLGATWPVGLPSGLDLAFQAWTVDATAPHGVSASGGLVAHLP